MSLHVESSRLLTRQCITIALAVVFFLLITGPVAGQTQSPEQPLHPPEEQSIDSSTPVIPQGQFNDSQAGPPAGHSAGGAESTLSASTASDALPFTINRIATDTALPDVIAVITESISAGESRVLWTSNGGQTWLRLAEPPRKYRSTPRDVAVVKRIDATQPIRFLLAYETAIYRSGDFGLSWTVSITTTVDPIINDYVCYLHNLSRGAGPYTLYVEESCLLLIDPPLRPADMWVGDRLHVSQDGGVTWRTSAVNGLRNFVPSPAVPDRVYAGDGYHVLNHQSDDGGQTWQQRPTLDGLDVVVQDRVDPNRLYGGVRASYLQSDQLMQTSPDGGNSWQDWGSRPCLISESFWYSEVRDSFPLVSTGQNQLWANCERSLEWYHTRWYYSGDAGNTWRASDAVDADVLAADMGHLGLALIATETGLWRSVDGGDLELVTADFPAPPPTFYYLPQILH